MTTTVDPDVQVRTLKDRVEQAQRVRIRAEHERDAATAKAQQATAALRAEYGVSTVEEAAAMLADLQRELAAEIDAASDRLTAAGA